MSLLSDIQKQAIRDYLSSTPDSTLFLQVATPDESSGDATTSEEWEGIYETRHYFDDVDEAMSAFETRASELERFMESAKAKSPEDYKQEPFVLLSTYPEDKEIVAYDSTFGFAFELK